MATAAQIRANRRNATRSTGPRTEDGKARSAANATRHGFFARDISAILPEDNLEERESRRMRLHFQWGPRDGAEAMLVDRLAEIRDELARAGKLEADYLAGQSRRVIDEEILRRSDEAEELGRILLEDDARGTSATELLRRLEATAEGCRWLLDRWDILEGGETWSIVDRTSFRRLLGESPREWLGDPEIERASLRSVADREIRRLEEVLAAREAEWVDEAVGLSACATCEVGAGFDRFLRHKAGLRREEGKTIDLLIRLTKTRGIEAKPRADREDRSMTSGSIDPGPRSQGLRVQEDCPVTASLGGGAIGMPSTDMRDQEDIHDWTPFEPASPLESTGVDLARWWAEAGSNRDPESTDAVTASERVESRQDDRMDDSQESPPMDLLSHRKGRPDPAKLLKAHRREQAQARLARAS